VKRDANDQRNGHLQGYTDEEEMRKLFWHYLNYGNTNTYYE